MLSYFSSIKRIPAFVSIYVLTKFNNWNFFFLFSRYGLFKFKFNKDQLFIDYRFPYLRLKGLNRGLLIHYSNIISKLSIGVRYGFSEFLKLVGLGFKYKLTSYYIYFVLGFSHIIKVPLVFNIAIRLLNKKKIIQLESHDYFLLHFFIHYLKSFRPLDVYKAKGIRLKGEVIVTKIGKQSAF